jgi:hypothetical protein
VTLRVQICLIDHLFVLSCGHPSPGKPQAMDFDFSLQGLF